MTKAPVAGDVKSRLAAQIGASKAAELYKCFLMDIVETLGFLGEDFIIYYTPGDALGVLRELLGEKHRYLPQKGADLGERLFYGLEQAKQMGYDAGFALASDVPDISFRYLNRGLDALEAHDVVIGPSNDGGYHLIGLKLGLNDESFFSGIAWGTDSVYAETIRRLGEIGVYVLPPWTDVDEASDLNLIDLSEGSHTLRYIKENGLS